MSETQSAKYKMTRREYDRICNLTKRGIKREEYEKILNRWSKLFPYMHVYDKILKVPTERTGEYEEGTFNTGDDYENFVTFKKISNYYFVKYQDKISEFMMLKDALKRLNCV